MVIQLAHNQPENPMAKMANRKTSQTTHVESEQTTSAWFLKVPKQLNIPNRFVRELVQISPNALDGQWLAWCVSGLSMKAENSPACNYYLFNAVISRSRVIYKS